MKRLKGIFVCFACAAAIVVAVCPTVAQEERAQRAVTLQSFVGTWVGTQRWDADIKSPGPAEEQEVTLTIEEFNGKLVGSLTPFFGGSDGASFGNGDLVGDELKAAGRIGQPKPGEPVAESRNQPRTWKGQTQIAFAFDVDRNNLKGAADVTLNGVKWLRFTYDLSRKRSRY